MKPQGWPLLRGGQGLYIEALKVAGEVMDTSVVMTAATGIFQVQVSCGANLCYGVCEIKVL